MTPEAAQKPIVAVLSDASGEVDSQSGQSYTITMRRCNTGEPLLSLEIHNHALEAAARKLNELRAQRTYG